MSHGVPRVSAGATTQEKSEKQRAKERQQIDAYRDLERDVTERIQARDFSNTTFQLTSTLLSQNPEYYTIWNHRRLLLNDVFTRELSSTTTTTPPSSPSAEKDPLTPPLREIHLLIREDLTFLLPLLKQYPKCYWIWNHRSWLLSSATTHLPNPTTAKLWEQELGLVGKMLALDSRNFHGWGYRRTVVEAIEKLRGNGEGEGGMVEKEFEYTTKMIRTNLSNFSAWHYRSQLIPRLLVLRGTSSEERRKFLDGEFELITTALYTDPYDQSLWFYHQYLLSTLDASNKQSSTILEPCTDEDRTAYLQQEVESIKDMLDGAEDCKYIYQALLDYSRRLLELRDAGREVGKDDMKGWLAELRKLDPIREGRWKDLEKSLERL